MKKTILGLSLVFLLCAALIKPDIFPKLVSSVETVKETRVHTTWKQDAEQAGDVRAFEDSVYYTQTPQAQIVSLSDSFAYINNEVIVYFKDGTSIAKKQSVLDSIQARVIGYTDILNQYQLQLPEEKSFSALQALCLQLNADKAVAFATCHFAQHLREDAIPDDPWLEPESGHTAAGNWNESNVYGGNWWLTATQTVSAWDHADYFHPIRIGILDSGFETTHEDLQNKISFPSRMHQRTNRPSSHGTHVAGIISANANNQIGITGICDKAELMCVDWEPEKDEQYWSTDERIFTGMIALIKSGAKVINLSLGASGGYEPGKTWSWNIGMNFEGMVFSFMMASLLSRGYDFLVVQSAGNGNKNGEPCDSFFNGSFCSIRKQNIFTGLTRISKQEILDHIMVVGSSTSSHKKTKFYQSSFSNYGSGVSIFAPGSYVFSTDLTEKGGYSYKSGTSMAAPVVTAIAALTWSVNPALRGSQVKAILCDPDNSIYTVENHYWDEMDIPTYNMVNAKLSVEAAIRTLGEPEPTTEEETTETESVSESESFVIHPTIPPTKPVQANREIPILDDSDQKYIERFRGEIGE